MDIAFPFPVLTLRPIHFRSCLVKTPAYSSLSTLCPGCQLSRQAALTRGGHLGCLSWGYSQGGDGSADSLTPTGVRRGWKGGHLAGIHNMCMCAHLVGEIPRVSFARWQGIREAGRDIKEVKIQKYRAIQLNTLIDFFFTHSQLKDNE